MNKYIWIYEQLKHLPEYKYPINFNELPNNGIYFFFENDELCTLETNIQKRIVRVGINRENGNFQSRIRSHFKGNKNSSVFRKHLGGALIRKKNPDDPRLEQWLTQDTPTFKEIEIEVSKIIQENYSFKCFPVDDKTERKNLEEELIATLASYPKNCSPSKNWLGHYAKDINIQKSGLWNTEHVNSTKSLSDDSMKKIQNLINTPSKDKKTLFLIPCCSKKAPDGNNPPWVYIHQNSQFNKFQFLDNNRENLINFYSNLKQDEAPNYYKKQGNTPKKRIEKAWKTNLHIREYRTTNAIDRYIGKLYSELSPDVKEQLRTGRVNNVLIISALMGIISPTDLIPYYELIMKDTSPNNKKLSKYWKEIFSIKQIYQPLKEIICNYNCIFCFLSEEYRESIKDLLKESNAYYVICQKGQENPRIWGHILNEILNKGLKNFEDIKKEIETHGGFLSNLESYHISSYDIKNKTDITSLNSKKYISIQTSKKYGCINMSQADEIRTYVLTKIIEPARNKGLKQITLKAGDIARQVTGGTNIPNVNNVLRGKKLQETCGIQLIDTGGTAGSSTAIYIYKILPKEDDTIKNKHSINTSVLEQEVTKEKGDLTDIIRKLAKLRDDNIITEEEFQKKKQELLDKI